MSELKNQFSQSFPALAPTADGRRRVHEAASSADRTRRRVFSRIRLSMGVAVAALAVGGVFFLTPNLSAAAYVQHIGQLVDDARSAHILEWRIDEYGKRQRSREMWYQQGKWRLDTPMFGHLTITDGQRNWTYSPSQNTVWVKPDLNGPFANPTQGFTLKSMLRGAKRNTVTIVPDGPFKKVTIDAPIDSGSIVIWVDSKSDYPVRGQLVIRTQNGPRLEGEFQCEFNQSLPANLFVPDFPKTAKVVDMVDGERYWNAEFAKKLGTIGKNITVRNLQITDRGDVFILYSGGFITKEGMTLTDSLGTEYAPCEGLQPYVGNTDGSKGKGPEGLQGAWWTPVKPAAGPWEPRRITLSVENVYYVVDPVKMKTWPANKPVPVSEMIPKRDALGAWTTYVAAPTCGEVPDYTPYLGMAPSTPLEFRMDRAEARYRYAFSKGLYADAEAALRDQIGAIGEAEATLGQSWNKRDTYFHMYQMVKAQGRNGEAVTWLRKVRDEPDGHPDPNIDAAFKREGLNN